MEPRRRSDFLSNLSAAFLSRRFRDKALENLAFVVDGAPQVMLNPVDLHEDLVEMPTPMLK